MRRSQEGGEQRVNCQAFDVLFYEGVYEAVFSKEEKRQDASQSCMEVPFSATVRGPQAACISSVLMAVVLLAEPVWRVEGCMGVASTGGCSLSAVSLLSPSWLRLPVPCSCWDGGCGCQLTASLG